MAQTRIYVTKDKELAKRTAKAWLVEKPGYHGAVVADSDEIVVKDAADPFAAPEWTTDGAGPWYLILATKDSFASGDGPAAALAGQADSDGSNG